MPKTIEEWNQRYIRIRQAEARLLVRLGDCLAARAWIDTVD
jgi:hypothetical protein